MRRPMLVSTSVSLLVALSGCGGDDDTTSADAAPDTRAASGSAADAATVDPSTMPPPGEAEAVVDGNTFRYARADSIEQAFSCDLGEQLLVNFQSDGDDLLIQVNPFDDGWAGSVVVASRETDNVYQGAGTYPASAFAVDGQYLVFEGEFVSSTRADPANQEEAGAGRVVVTCP